MTKIEWIRPAAVVDGGPRIDKRHLLLAPHATQHDPFILWGEDWFRRGAFDWHPHRGFETVTYVREGTMEYSDSTGTRGTLAPGELLWTTAGAGFLHDGQPVGDTVARAMQLWLNLPAAHKWTAPREQKFISDEVPDVGSSGCQARLFSGTVNGQSGPATSPTNATFIELTFEAGGTVLGLSAGQNATLYVMDGTLEVHGQSVPAGHVARVVDGHQGIQVKATQPGSALLIAGTPLEEPVVVDGPFVMNTQAEIDQAYADLEAGVFGQLVS